MFLLLALVSVVSAAQQDLGCAARLQRAYAIHTPGGKSLAENRDALFGVTQFYLGRLSAEDPGKDWNAMMFEKAKSMTEPDELVLRGVTLCTLRAFSLSSGQEDLAAPDSTQQR